MTDGKPASPDFFNREMAVVYDKRNSDLAPITDNLHFLVRLVLDDLPVRARILAVGVGTGAEILSLGRAFPRWSFVGLDPSAGMLEVCRDRLGRANLLERCELVEGFVEDLPRGADLDAVLSLLVAHFVPRENRTGFYRNIHDRLRPGGRFVSAEICGDFGAAEFPEALRDWERVQRLMGATPEQLRKLPEMLRDTLCVLSPGETDALLREAGFAPPVPFFQSFLLRGVHARKGSGEGESRAGD